MTSSTHGAAASTPACSATTAGGTVLTSTDASLTSSAKSTSDQASTSTATPERRAASTVSVIRPGSRTTRRARASPRSANATTVAAAVPPPPRITPVEPAGASKPPAARSAPATPSTSVQSANQAESLCTNVFAAPAASARGVADLARVSAARLPGMVTETPAHSGPRLPTSAGKPSASTSIRSYVHGRPNSRYAAPCRTGESECPTGLPRTAALVCAIGLCLRDVLPVLVPGDREAGQPVLLAPYEVHPVARRRL